MLSKDYLMLRSARRVRLEARTALLQRSFRRVDQLPDSLLRRDDDHAMRARDLITLAKAEVQGCRCDLSALDCRFPRLSGNCLSAGSALCVPCSRRGRLFEAPLCPEEPPQAASPTGEAPQDEDSF
jgi:hypothetical protein